MSMLASLSAGIVWWSIHACSFVSGVMVLDELRKCTDEARVWELGASMSYDAASQSRCRFSEHQFDAQHADICPKAARRNGDALALHMAIGSTSVQV